MTYAGRSPFDLTVEGVSGRILTMGEIITCHKSYLAKKEYEPAKAVLEYGIQCGSLQSKLEMARFLRNTPQLKMAQNDRYHYAEKLYRDVQNTLDISDKIYAQIAVELASLCESLNRPVGCLGNLLKAKRYGYLVQDKDIELCRRRLMRRDIYSLSGNAQDCLDLGYELFLADSFKYSEFFLREASVAQDNILAGQACLYLADLYAAHSNGNENHRKEAQKYYRKAKEKHFPEILSRK